MIDSRRPHGPPRGPRRRSAACPWHSLSNFPPDVTPPWRAMSPRCSYCRISWKSTTCQPACGMRPCSGVRRRGPRIGCRANCWGRTRPLAKAKGTHDSAARSGFAKWFESRGVVDPAAESTGSLHTLDLQTRLFRHRLSPFRHSRVVESLPRDILARIDRRIELVLRGREDAAPFDAWPENERTATLSAWRSARNHRHQTPRRPATESLSENPVALVQQPADTQATRRRQRVFG